MTGEPVRTTALAAFTELLSAVGAREVTLGSQVSIRVDPASAGIIGLPAHPNTWLAVGEREVLWLGPDEWLVTSGPEQAVDVVRDLEARLGSTHRSILDVSANRVVVELPGEDRLDLLAAGCGLDLHPRSWRVGMCAQTLVANVAALLQERGEATRVFVRPSNAAHLVAWCGRGSGR